MKNSPEALEVWKLLSFQYKPLEKLALKSLEESKREDLIKKYKNFSIPQKINFLDKTASLLNL